MKRTCLALLAFTLSCSLAAQVDKKNEISIGIGISSNEIPHNAIKNIISDMFNGESKISTNDKKRSGFYGSYKYRINKSWALGSTVTYKYFKQESTFDGIYSKYTQNFYGINLECQYTYLTKRVFRMYVLAGTGVYTCKESFKIFGEEERKASTQATAFTYQLSPLCFEVGTTIGAKLEYGYGYKGIASAGFYMRF